MGMLISYPWYIVFICINNQFYITTLSIRVKAVTGFAVELMLTSWRVETRTAVNAGLATPHQQHGRRQQHTAASPHGLSAVGLRQHSADQNPRDLQQQGDTNCTTIYTCYSTSLCRTQQVIKNLGILKTKFSKLTYPHPPCALV